MAEIPKDLIHIIWTLKIITINIFILRMQFVTVFYFVYYWICVFISFRTGNSYISAYLRYFCHPLFNMWSKNLPPKPYLKAPFKGVLVPNYLDHWGVAICSGRIIKSPLQSLKFAGHAECDSTYRSVMHTPTFNVRLISLSPEASYPHKLGGG